MCWLTKGCAIDSFTVVTACQLEQDIASFEFGHDTMIGERGITLSGGQKARVSLARTVYATHFQQPGMLVLLDDPLSAVDPGVGERIFAQCILGLLKNTTRVLVTHHLHVAQQADQVVVLASDGSLAGCGPYEALVSQGLGLREFAERNLDVGPEQRRRSINVQHAAATADDDDDDGYEDNDGGVSSSDHGQQRSANKLIAREMRRKGRVALRTLVAYLTPMGSVWHLLLILALFAVAHVIRIIMDWYLSEWMGEFDPDIRNSETRFGIYAALFASFACVVFVPTMLLGSATAKTSLMLHEKLLGSVLAAPMRFFDTQPVGRLLNRFRCVSVYECACVRVCVCFFMSCACAG
jgi:ABC-type multidrug transport system fused ATPase/permease subunit